MKLYETSVTAIFAGKNKINKQHKTEIEQARAILKSLGVCVAARYLAKRQWTIDAALWALFGVGQRFEGAI